MFSTDVDHSPYFEPDLDHLAANPGFPYSRIHDWPSKESQAENNEKLLMAVHGSGAQLLVITNKKVALYKIPAKKGFFKKAFNTAVGTIPVVSDVLEGIDSAKDLAGGAKNLRGWVSGKNKKEKLAREAAGMPSKKAFKNVEWDLRKEDGLAMVMSYRDDILMANGFHWKSKFQVENSDTYPINVTLQTKGLEVKCGKKKTSIKFSKNDGFTHDLIQQNRDLLKKANYTVEG